MKIAFAFETSGKGKAAVEAAKAKLAQTKATWRLKKVAKLKAKLAKAESEFANEPRR